jgi:thymidylate synthase (FAD)
VANLSAQTLSRQMPFVGCVLRFLRLRADAHAQYEIRVYAELLLDIVRQWVPLSYEAFVEYQLNSTTLSATAIKVIQQRLAGESVDQASSGLSIREWNDLCSVFSLA